MNHPKHHDIHVSIESKHSGPATLLCVRPCDLEFVLHEISLSYRNCWNQYDFLFSVVAVHIAIVPLEQDALPRLVRHVLPDKWLANVRHYTHIHSFGINQSDFPVATNIRQRSSDFEKKLNVEVLRHALPLHPDRHEILQLSTLLLRGHRSALHNAMVYDLLPCASLRWKRQHEMRRLLPLLKHHSLPILMMVYLHFETSQVSIV